MRIYKTTYNDRGGDTRKSGKWYADFMDHIGIRRRLPLFTDKRASEEADRHINRLVEVRQSRQAPDPALLAFIESIPSALREKLAEYGLLSPQESGLNKANAALLASWNSVLLGAGRNEKYVTEHTDLAKKVLLKQKMTYPSDIALEPVRQFLAALHQEGKSPRTLNAHLIAIKAYCNWLVSSQILPANPLIALQKYNEAVDRRRTRRALTAEEIRVLLNAVKYDAPQHGLCGWGRYLLYRVALETGLRWNEIVTLQRRELCFTSDKPTVTVRAENSKHRTEDCLPLRQELAEDLKQFLEQTPALPTALLFSGVWPVKGGNMLKLDLLHAREVWLTSVLEKEGAEAAKQAEASDFLKDKDSKGDVLDFHSLRHTFGTLLAKSGVHPKIAQDLMRHSDISLTMNRYTHTLLENRAEAVDLLPDFSANTPMLRQTGTEAIDDQVEDRSATPLRGKVSPDQPEREWAMAFAPGMQPPYSPTTPSSAPVINLPAPMSAGVIPPEQRADLAECERDSEEDAEGELPENFPEDRVDDVDNDSVFAICSAKLSAKPRNSAQRVANVKINCVGKEKPQHLAVEDVAVDCPGTPVGIRTPNLLIRSQSTESHNRLFGNTCTIASNRLCQMLGHAGSNTMHSRASIRSAVETSRELPAHIKAAMIALLDTIK